MIRLILNIVLMIILALCVWGGFKRGLIGSVAGILAVVVSLVAANAFATAYAKQLVPALNPFIGGYIDSDSTTSSILDNLGYGGSDLSLDDILAQDSSLRYDYAYEAIHAVGFYTEISEELAGDAVTFADKNNIGMTDSVITVVCNTVAYVGCVTIVFIMLLILITAILDMINLNFRFPNIDVVDEVSGAALGLLKGFLYCVLLSWVLGFAGLIIGGETANQCVLVRFFLAFRFITRSLI